MAIPGARLYLVADTDHNFGPRDARLRVRGHLVAFLNGIGQRSGAVAADAVPGLTQVVATLGAFVGTAGI